MYRIVRLNRRFAWALGLSALAFAGCTSPIKHDFDPFAHAATYDVPRELQKASLPAYRVEPPVDRRRVDAKRSVGQARGRKPRIGFAAGVYRGQAG